MARNISRLVTWFVAGIVAVWIMSTTIAHPLTDAQHVSLLLQPTSLDKQEESSTSDLSPQAVFRRGLDHYQLGQFSQAIEQWTQAGRQFADQSLMADQSLALGYRALSYQQLGQVDRANADLTESLNLLKSLSDDQYHSSDAEIYAKVLNIKGILHWHQGQLESALASWQEAERFYVEAGQIRGMAIAQINQAKVLQALGLSQQAASLLSHVYNTLSIQQDRELQVMGFQHLGSVLRQIGDLELADSVLQDGLSLASDPQSVNAILLELGNINWERGDRLQSTGQMTDAQANFQLAQRYYQQVLEAKPSLETQLNLVGLLIQTGQLDEAVHYLSAVPDLIDQHSVGRQRIRATISFAERWLQVAKQHHTHRIANLSYVDVAQMLSEAVRDAQTVTDRRAESYALGQLGKIYEHLGQTTDAQQITQAAQLKLEGLDAPDIQYQWEWQLGRIAKAKGNRQSALAHYEAAVASLQSVRGNLLSINADIQFSFRDNVEPVYREFVELLLTTDSTHSPNQQRLEKALLTIDQLQLAELENYLGCEIDSVGQVQTVQDKTSVRIYPIVQGDRLALIVQFPEQSELTYYETSASIDEISGILQAFRTDLSIPGRTPEVIDSATQLYDWLIRPLEADLQQSNAKTLVFVPDGELRNVPMAALFDGEQYLIQKGYATAIAPRLELFLPNETSTQLEVNLGGIG
ncbi:MAG: CHAT domain-containing protein, partial [Cyanobacteria bacterium J06633_2]